MAILSAGANVPVPGTELTVTVRWTASPGAPEVDASALLVGASGKVGSDADFVFYNQPEAAAGAVRHTGPVPGGQELRVRPSGLPAAVDRVVVTASVDQGSFGAVPGLAITVQDASGTVVAEFAPPGATTETVFVLGELYRRQGAFKFRAVGQGYASGLAGLATDYGVTVDEAPSPQPPPPAAPPAPAPAPMPAFAPAPQAPAPQWQATEDSLPIDLRKRIDLRKQQVSVVLEKKGLTGVRARLAMVLDASGSMTALYKRGTVAGVVERMAPVAAQLSSDQSLEAWIFATEFLHLPPLRIPELPQWTQSNVRMSPMPVFALGRRRRELMARDPHARLGVQNEEPKVIRDILDWYHAQPPGDPLLILFFSDGGVHRNNEIASLLRKASEHAIFWQFVGIGRSNYGVLEQFDTMGGRVVDNAGFFSVDDIDQISDSELYDRILNEFPQWLQDARRAGVIR